MPGRDVGERSARKPEDPDRQKEPSHASGFAGSGEKTALAPFGADGRSLRRAAAAIQRPHEAARDMLYHDRDGRRADARPCDPQQIEEPDPGAETSRVGLLRSDGGRGIGEGDAAADEEQDGRQGRYIPPTVDDQRRGGRSERKDYHGGAQGRDATVPFDERARHRSDDRHGERECEGDEACDYRREMTNRTQIERRRQERRTQTNRPDEDADAAHDVRRFAKGLRRNERDGGAADCTSEVDE